MKRTRKRISVIIVSALAVLALALSFAFRDGDFKIIKSLDLFYAVFKEVNLYYADEQDPEKLVKKSIDSMLGSLDPFTHFYSGDDVKDLKQMRTGQYGGVGATIMQHEGKTYIAELIEKGPACETGVRQGDILVKVDSVFIIKQNVNEIGELLRGEPNTFVNVTISRLGTEMNYKIKRGKISIPNVPYYGLANDSIGFIRLSNFAGNAAREVKNALTELKKKYPIKGVILDLRGNPGGLLNEAVSITNLFVDKDVEIVSLKRRNTVREMQYKTSQSPVDTEIPLVILVNKESASASEVVSGSIQDLDRGVIIGQKTYGKGLVQTERPLPYNSFLNITTSKYYIPSGRCIQALDYFHKTKDGVAPSTPDSLVKKFKTKNGRTVDDAGGIKPDIAVIPDTLNDFMKSLEKQNMIFSFATVYASSHAPVTDVRTFHITDQDLAEFEKFLEKNKFRYQNESEIELEKLIRSLQKNDQYESTLENISKIQSAIRSDLTSELKKNKEYMARLLKEEICSRYYFIKGKIGSSLTSDQYVIEAVKVLNDRILYNHILQNNVIR